MVDPSLIAKNTISPSPKRPSQIAAKGGSFLMVLGLVFLLIVGGIWGGLMFYKGSLENELNSKTDELSRLINKLDPQIINEILQVDRGLTVARSMLGSHVYISNIFKLLEESTLETVSFKRFMYSLNANAVTVDGDVRTYVDLERQVQHFKGLPDIRSVSFSNLSVSLEGFVGFTMQLMFDPEILRYNAN